jgi:hypothetical protein
VEISTVSLGMPIGGDELYTTSASGSSRPTKAFAKGRVCKEPGCETKLSIYNKGKYCYIHQPVMVPRTRGRKNIA